MVSWLLPRLSVTGAKVPDDCGAGVVWVTGSLVVGTAAGGGVVEISAGVSCVVGAGDGMVIIVVGRFVVVGLVVVGTGWTLV